MEMDGAPKKVGQLIKVPAGLPLIRVTNTLPSQTPSLPSVSVPLSLRSANKSLATWQQNNAKVILIPVATVPAAMSFPLD